MNSRVLRAIPIGLTGGQRKDKNRAFSVSRSTAVVSRDPFFAPQELRNRKIHRTTCFGSPGPPSKLAEPWSKPLTGQAPSPAKTGINRDRAVLRPSRSLNPAPVRATG